MQESYQARRAYGNQLPYRSGYEGGSDFDTRRSYVDVYPAPRPRSFEGYQRTPADRRPELRTSPAFRPGEQLPFKRTATSKKIVDRPTNDNPDHATARTATTAVSISPE